MERQHILNFSFKGENNVKNFLVSMKEKDPQIQEICIPISESRENQKGKTKYYRRMTIRLTPTIAQAGRQQDNILRLTKIIGRPNI